MSTRAASVGSPRTSSGPPGRASAATRTILSGQSETSPQNDEFAAGAAEALTAHVLSQGFEQGCWLPAAAEDCAIPSATALDELRRRWSKLAPDGARRCIEIEMKVVPGLKEGHVATDGFV